MLDKYSHDKRIEVWISSYTIVLFPIFGEILTVRGIRIGCGNLPIGRRTNPMGAAAAARARGAARLAVLLGGPGASECTEHESAVTRRSLRAGPPARRHWPPAFRTIPRHVRAAQRGRRRDSLHARTLRLRPTRALRRTERAGLCALQTRGRLRSRCVPSLPDS